MERPWTVVPYDIDRLKALIVEHTQASGRVVEAKLHSVYFRDYFRDIGARTILVEKDYVDRDFLEDFAGYYARCFHDYVRRCTRLHFFKEAFSEEAFDQLIAGDEATLTAESLNDLYLGFIVLKPLPTTVIGRTCLATYDSDGYRRVYPSLRTYEVSLYGILLTVSTLAFQEQDAAVAACATSAMWSAFQGTGKLFQHAIPSPVELTKLATEGVPLNTRILPSQGLTTLQMANAIRSVGLEPLVIAPDDIHTLKATVYAYIRAGIPVLMGVDLFDRSVPLTDEDVPNGLPSFEHRGLHAVAVTGYSLGARATEPYGQTGFKLRATRIDKFYAHDDQVGPFSRMPCQKGTTPNLDTSWRGRRSGKIGDTFARAMTVLVPLYPKIRIAFDAIHDAIPELDEAIRWLFEAADEVSLIDDLEWDIWLTSVQQLKMGIRSERSIPARYRADLLQKSLPRFLWVAEAHTARGPLCTLLLDATDLEQGNWLVAWIEYDRETCEILRALPEPDIIAFMAEEGFSPGSLDLLEWLRENGGPAPESGDMPPPG